MWPFTKRKEKPCWEVRCVQYLELVDGSRPIEVEAHYEVTEATLDLWRTDINRYAQMRAESQAERIGRDGYTGKQCHYPAHVISRVDLWCIHISHPHRPFRTLNDYR